MCDLIQSRLCVYSLYSKIGGDNLVQKATAICVLLSGRSYARTQNENAKHKFAMCHYTNVSVPFRK